MSSDHPETTKKHVLDMTEDERNRAEWRAIGHTLREAQQRLQSGGSRETWMDWAINVAAERGKEHAT
jgi:hypothetical protein